MCGVMALGEHRVRLGPCKEVGLLLRLQRLEGDARIELALLERLLHLIVEGELGVLVPDGCSHIGGRSNAPPVSGVEHRGDGSTGASEA